MMKLGSKSDSKTSKASGNSNEININAVLEITIEAVLVVNAEGTLIYANRKAGEITGFKPQELMGKDYQSLVFFPEECLEQIERLLELGSTGRSVGPSEFELKRKDGKKAWIEAYINPVQQDDNFLVTVLFQNITGHKQAKEALKESQDFSTNLIDNAPNPMMVLNPDFSVRYINSALEKLVGFATKDIIGKKPPYPWWPEEYREEIGASLKDDIARGGKKRESVFRKRDGEPFCVEVQSAPIINDGKMDYFLVSWTDITDRTRAGEALRGSEEKFRNLFVHAKDAVILADTQTDTIIDVNPAGCRLLGLPKEKIIGMHQSEMHPPEMVEKYKQVFRGYVERGIVVNDDIIIQRANGTQAQVELSASVVKLAGKKMIQWVFRNVTERKQMEKALKESEEKFSAAFRASPSAISITTLRDGVFLDVNEGFLRENGYTREEIIGHSSKELKIWVKPEERDKILHKLRESGRAENEEYSSRTKYGEVRTMLLSAEPINIAGESCIIAVTTDITERKQAEQALKESEEKFSAAFRASPNAISITTLKDGIFLDINDSFTRVNGYTREEIIGRSSKELKIWVKPEERDRIFHILRERGRAVNEEYSSRTKSGKIRTLLLSAEPLTIAGEPCIIAVTTDITDRKRMENELKTHGNDLEEMVHERTDELTDVSQRLKRELEEREKIERELRKAKIDIEIVSGSKS